MLFNIETVKRSKLKFNDKIQGSFCEAIYVYDEGINKPANEYQKYKFKEIIHTYRVPVFHVYLNSDDNRPYIISGFGVVKRFINNYDLKQFRKLNKKSNAI